jgi:peptide/nickel transport system substrate-binding protein
MNTHEQDRMKRLVVSTAMLALGVTFAAAAYAVPDAKAPRGAIREGGVFRVALGAESFDYVDPALAWTPLTWTLLQMTCAKLMNYQDKPLPAGQRAVPEVAAGYPRVSPDGKMYTFTLRRGFRFSNGAKLDANAFARQIQRIRELKSEGGLQYVADIAGVVAKGRRLTIRLARPNPNLTARLAMPFFCAVQPRLLSDPEGAGAYASAGPYYIAEYRPGQRIVMRRNRYYGGTRTHHVERFDMDLVSSAEALERFKRGTADWASPRGAVLYPQARELARKYGSSGRLSFRPAPSLWFYVLNTERPLFRGNARLRRAVNFAVDRRALVRVLGYGFARPTDQYLPFGFPGFRDENIYPFGPRLKTAKALARGRLRGGKAVLYVPDVPTGLSLAQVLKANLAKIGLQVEIKAFPLGVHLDKVGTRGEPFDIAWSGWLTDYNDPSSFINFLLDGRRIALANNTNTSYFNSPRFNRLIARASRLSGPARYRAYAKLDRQLVRDAAPMVSFANLNAATLVSARVDPRCKILNPGLDLAAVCLKR